VTTRLAVQSDERWLAWRDVVAAAEGL
jgi:hypothetical protein